MINRIQAIFLFLTFIFSFPAYGQITILPKCNEETLICPFGTSAVCEGEDRAVCMLGSEANFTPGCLGESGFAEGGTICKSKESSASNPFVFEIKRTPVLPEIISIPDVSGKFNGIAGVLFPGSKPTFEILYNLTNIQAQVTKVNILDSDGVLFSNIPFSVFEIEKESTVLPRTPFIVISGADNQRRELLIIEVPDNVATGEATLVIELDDGNQYSGFLQVVDFMQLKVKQKEKFVDVLQPEIKTISLSKKRGSLIFKVKGKGFLAKEVFQKQGGKLQKIKFNNPQTAITFFPENLKTRVTNLKVSRNGKNLNIFLDSVENIKKKTRAVLVISTLRGIFSFPFDLVPSEEGSSTIFCPEKEFVCR